MSGAPPLNIMAYDIFFVLKKPCDLQEVKVRHSKVKILLYVIA